MYRLTFDDKELHVFIGGEFAYTLQLDEFPALQEAKDQALEVVRLYRTPEQIRRDAITEIAIAADPQAVAEAIPEWQPGTHYRIGQFVQHVGRIYRILQAHTSQADWLPDVASALYTRADKTTTDPVEAIPEWIQPTGAHDAYGIGDQVKFEGKTYESLIPANTHSPTAYPQAWKEIE